MTDRETVSAHTFIHTMHLSLGLQKKGTALALATNEGKQPKSGLQKWALMGAWACAGHQKSDNRGIRHLVMAGGGGGGLPSHLALLGWGGGG